MKQVFLQKGKVFVQDVPLPLLEENNVLIKVYYSFISSGTEIATVNVSEKTLFSKFLLNPTESTQKILGAVKENGIEGTLALIKDKSDYVSSLGYSCSGQIVAIGSKVEKFRVGDFVACAGSGFANHAQVVSVPSNLVVKVSEKFLKQASLTTIGSIAMQAVRRADLKLGEKVCILGLGLIGQIIVQLAKLSGCQVFGVDLRQERLSLAQKLGADFVFSPHSVDLKKEIDFLTNHYGMDSTIIAAAANSGDVINQAMNLTRRKGKVVLVGDVKLDFERENFYSKEIDFLISCSYGPGRYDPSYERDGKDYPYSYVRWTENRNMDLFTKLVEDKKLLIDPLISSCFDLDQVEKAYSFLRESKALGIVLSYEKEATDDFLQNLIESLVKEKGKEEKVLPFIPPAGKVKIGVVGVGGFAKVKLLPILSKIKKAEIHSLVDTNAAGLLNIARVYQAKHIGSDFKKLFFDEDINLVLIATPHKCHFEQSLEALKSGKAVFVEKPAVTTFEQLEKLKDFFKNNKKSLYCVDFNRSFAPFNLAVKDVISKRKNPLIINYRMNAGFIPKDHWIQGCENGGRIIGEACHIFDLFCFLTDAKPISVHVQSINHGSDDLLSNDNMIATLSMSDGSCCSLTYTSLGSNLLNKERMELFFDGKSIVMQDYLRLRGYGLSVSFNKKTFYPDKGHESLISQFIQAAKLENGVSPIPVERILVVSQISLIVDKLARKGGGFELFS